MKSLNYKVLVVLLQLSTFIIHAQTSFEEKTITGSEHDFMTVKHVKITGSNKEIGGQIAKIAQQMGVELIKKDTFINRIQTKYLKENYPIHYMRMQGVAEANNLSVDNYNYTFSEITYLPIKTSCSAVFYPSDNTYNGHDILSRNFDFTTGNLQMQKCKNDELPILSRPIVFEIYPLQGYSSIYVCGFELLSGVIDGINSEGLSVAVFGDGMMNEGLMPEPAMGKNIGLHDLQVLRYILDNCKNVKEAKEAFLKLKLYYELHPEHYMISDKDGNSFIFEFSRYRNQYHIIDGKGIQSISNHLIHNENNKQTPKESVERLNKLKSMTQYDKQYSLDEIKDINMAVSPLSPDVHPVIAANRTLWHSIYDLDNKSLMIKLYQGEGSSGDGSVTAMYSDYFEFSLENE